MMSDSVSRYLERTEEMLKSVRHELDDLEWNAGDHERIMFLRSQEHALSCMVADGILYQPKF